VILGAKVQKSVALSEACRTSDYPVATTIEFQGRAKFFIIISA
jgi:hypothetical protein